MRRAANLKKAMYGSPELGAGVHRDDGRGWAHTGIIGCVHVLPQGEEYAGRRAWRCFQSIWIKS